MSDFLGLLLRTTELRIVQKRELAELFGFETRNKYSIEASGVPIAFAAEQGKSVLAFFARLFFGHWRSFEIQFFDTTRQLVLSGVHPFRFFFQRLEVSDAAGRELGAIQQRFAMFSKRFDVVAPTGQLLLSVSSPLWRPWTFVFLRAGVEVARVEKKWSGLLREAFTDADRFRVVFTSQQLRAEERALVLAAGLFVDLQYFENKAQRG